MELNVTKEERIRTEFLNEARICSNLNTGRIFLEVVGSEWRIDAKCRPGHEKKSANGVFLYLHCYGNLS